jgi:hypothetical protein
MKSINNTNRSYVTRNFSNFDIEEPIDEAFDFLKGKARLYGDVEQAVTDAGAFFDSYMGDPNQKAAAESAKSKTDKVLADLRGKKPKDHERSDYRSFLDDIEKAKSEFKDKQNQILSKIKEYADVAKIIEEASKMSAEAAKKATDVNIEISKKKDERNIKLKDAIKISKTLKKDEVKGKNEEINKVQKEFIRKFESNPKIKDSAIFKKIKDAVETKKQGGFFGPTTEKIIKGLKAGFGMDDKSSDITQELINKIYTEKISESESARSIKGFSDFDVMNEDFDAAKFLEVVGSSEKDGKDKKDKDKKVKVSVDKVKEEMKKASDKSYEENKEGIDYMMDKMFTPSIDGKDLFKTLFLKSWDDFTKLDDDEKKEFLSINFKNHDSLQPADKSKIDLFFKKGNSSPKVDSSLDDK